MLCVLNGTVSMRPFFCVPRTHVKNNNKKQKTKQKNKTKQKKQQQLMADKLCKEKTAKCMYEPQAQSCLLEKVVLD